MLDITRARGGAQGRNAGSAFNGFVWAVATDQSDAAGMTAQTVNTLKALDGVLAELGSDKTRLLSATVYVANIHLKDQMDRAWCEWIGTDPEHWPQRACVETGLHGETLVEIVVLAAQR